MSGKYRLRVASLSCAESIGTVLTLSSFWLPGGFPSSSQWSLIVASPPCRGDPSSCPQCSWASILSFYHKVATLREPSMAGFKCIAHSIEDKLHRDDHYGDCTGKGRERKLCRCCGWGELCRCARHRGPCVRHRLRYTWGGSCWGAALGHLQTAVSLRAAWPLFRAVCRQRGVVAVLHWAQ